MNKSIVMGKKQQYFAVVLSVILSFLVVWAVAFGASTISGNISTGGTLTVTGASTLSSTLNVTGLATLGFASSTSISLTQNLMVNGMATTTGSTGNIATEGTLTVGGASTLTGAVGITGLTTLINATTTRVSISQNLMVNGMATTTGSTGNIATEGTLTVAGATTLSSTLGVTSGLTTLSFASTTSISLTQNLMVNKMATTTGSTGNIATEGTIISVGKNGVGTTTPATEYSADSTATTTVALYSSTSAVGGCLQMEGSNGTPYRMYVGRADIATTSTGRPAGTIIAYWEAGSCK
ncbi:MAG: hypothetical protein Athens071426_145 [Parcubacteria group bacterium Athens0714_26]|nr:MAG: hypothetical protein Athens071426_145 [Parcubacteria group bacterium Athens0714_26]